MYKPIYTIIVLVDTGTVLHVRGLYMGLFEHTLFRVV